PPDSPGCPLSPARPGDPAGPAGPTMPGAPARPDGPAGPTGPARPAGPSGPAGPYTFQPVSPPIGRELQPTANSARTPNISARLIVSNPPGSGELRPSLVVGTLPSIATASLLDARRVRNDVVAS